MGGHTVWPVRIESPNKPLKLSCKGVFLLFSEVPAFLRSFPKMLVAFNGLLTHAKHKKQLSQVAFDVPLERGMSSLVVG